MRYFHYVYLVLAALIVSVGLGLVYEKDRSLRLRSIPHMQEDTRGQMKAMAEYLRSYVRSTGRYPSNDEGLLAVKPLVEACEELKYSEDPIHHCRVRDSGILTRWGDPFIYENRRGLDLALFADSGATIDERREYSVKVDEGIYIWSLAAQHSGAIHKKWRTRLSVTAYVLGLAALVCFILYVCGSIRAQAGRVSALGAAWVLVRGLLVGGAIWLFLFPMYVKTCYIMSTMRSRTPELTNDCQALIAKYRSRGIISDHTYKKLRRALDEERERGR